MYSRDSEGNRGERDSQRVDDLTVGRTTLTPSDPVKSKMKICFSCGPLMGPSCISTSSPIAGYTSESLVILLQMLATRRRVLYLAALFLVRTNLKLLTHSCTPAFIMSQRYRRKVAVFGMPLAMLRLCPSFGYIFSMQMVLVSRL